MMKIERLLKYSERCRDQCLHGGSACIKAYFCIGVAEALLSCSITDSKSKSPVAIEETELKEISPRLSGFIL
jgi:hypothetical protein